MVLPIEATTLQRSVYRDNGDGDSNNTIAVSVESPLESNGAFPVNVLDQSSRPFDIRLNTILNADITLLETQTANTYAVTLSPGHNLNDGDSIAILEQNGTPEVYFGTVLDINGDILTLDTPLPYSFTTAATVFSYNNMMNVDGSVTPAIYSITNFFPDSVDIVRFIFHITDETSMDDGKFGGIGGGLTRGIVLRKRLASGQYINYFNIKNNGQFGELAYDKSYDDKAPAGVYGLTSRLTFGGQSKHGVVIRLDPGDSIELLIQDDLESLASFTAMVQGHFTTE